MKLFIISAILLALPGLTSAEEAAPTKNAPAPITTTTKNPDAVDISGLEEDYWRPNKDELEVVQNRRFEKKGKFELGLHYGMYQGQDFVDQKSVGGSLTYNFTNSLFAEISYHKINSTDNDFLQSVQKQFGFRPDFNLEQNQTVAAIGWTPIYAKFALFGQKISHFETYFAPGIGITKTAANHFSGHFTVGEKFWITERVLFRVEWRISKFKDSITATQGSAARRNGGSGFVEQSETTHNIIFGVGVLF